MKLATLAALLGLTSATQTPEKKMEYAKFLQGMLEPYGGKFNLEALLICIYEEDQAALILDTAVQIFEEAYNDKDPVEAIGGVIAVVAAVQQFKQGLPACESIDKSSWNMQEFMESTDIALHPSEYFEVIKKDIMINGMSIIHDMKKGVDAYKAKDYKTFGFEVGKIFKMATEHKSMKTQIAAQKPNSKRAAEFAQGFLDAANVGKFNLENLLICIYEADQAALILDVGVQQLEKAWKDRDIEEAIPGVIAGIAFVQQLKQALPPCEHVDTKNANWSTFDHIVEVAESPKEHMQLIEKDVLFNGVKITEDLSTALEAMRSGNTKEYGYELGKIMTLATQEKASENLFLY